MQAWSFDLVVKIHAVLRDELDLSPQYRTDYVVFDAGSAACLKLFYGPDSGRMGTPPRVDVVNFTYPRAVPHRKPDFVGRYPQVTGELDLSGTEHEAVEEVRQAGEFLRDHHG